MPRYLRTRRLGPVVAIGGAAIVVAGALAAVVATSRPADGPIPCVPSARPAGWSVARQWNEALLDAIRRDLPAPTVHARNLFHASAAMWDAWAAYDPVATGLFVIEKHRAENVSAAREEAISYAAYRVLEARYRDSIGAGETLAELDELMIAGCHPISLASTDGDAPAALGNRIAATILAAGVDDGANEAEGYVDPDYRPVNRPLTVADPGTTMLDPNRWQPLRLERMVSQNGIPVENGVQEFIDPHWGGVAGFGLPDGGPGALPIDPGPPPRLGEPASDAEFRAQAVEIVRYSRRLDPTSGIEIDVSPGALGANPLGSNDGPGHALNPATGRPYPSNRVLDADYGRALAEFWADGPKSETPPGHWNTIANAASDALDPELRVGGRGPLVDRLEWDVKLYLAVNGATHDAAIAAWGIKKHVDSARPISMIRFLGGNGQSSDPDGPAFHPDGIPLEAGLVEVITTATTRPGERHAHLAGHEGEIAIRAWAGNPADPETELGGVAWIRAVEWVPYQAATFVTPAFGGYVSGHSTFSRAAAEVLTAMTGDEFFPGGISEWTIEADGFATEAGPDRPVTLQWATYRDAADQAGLSRLFGGIHIRADDLTGRVIGAQVGLDAWSRAAALFAGR